MPEEQSTKVSGRVCATWYLSHLGVPNAGLEDIGAEREGLEVGTHVIHLHPP